MRHDHPQTRRRRLVLLRWHESRHLGVGALRPGEHYGSLHFWAVQNHSRCSRSPDPHSRDQMQELVFFSRGRKRKEFVCAGVRIARSASKACVGQMCVAAQVAHDVRGDKPSFWVISRHEFDCAEPVRLVLPVWLQNIPAICSQDRQSPSFPASRVKTRVQGRYNMGVFSRVLTGSLQGITERPLPCNYNVIQFVCALSRRRRGFKSRRGRQINNLGKKYLLSA